MQSVFRCSRHICWGMYHSGRSNSQNLGGKMMRPAHVAITWPPLGRLHQFGSVDLEGASSIWATAEVRWCQIRTIGKTGKNLPPPSVTEVRYGASNVWPGIIVQQQYSKLKKHLRGLPFQTDEYVQQEVKWWLPLQNASFYYQGFDSLIYCYDKCLNRYGDYVVK
jgi:hypothetical protein